MKKLIRRIMFFVVIVSAGFAEAHEAAILFVPSDARPISLQQTSEVLQSIGCNVVSPPAEYFGNNKYDGEPEKILQWLEENIHSANAVVIASDSVLYGGLIPSRKHNYTQEELDARIERIKTICEENSSISVYIFASLMRTPTFAVEGFDEEPKYYVTYGSKIFRLTALMDKQEISGLTNDEKKHLASLRKDLPEEILQDWFDRREKNLSVTKKFMDYVTSGKIKYLVVGRDDNSPLCQTHKENRELLRYAESHELTREKFQSLAGIDEFGLLLLTRAVNDMLGETPSVYVKYNHGTGAKTIPAYSDEYIGTSIEDAIIIAGGEIVNNPDDADLVLLVNTPPDGISLEPHNALPSFRKKLDDRKYIKNAEIFTDMIEEYINAGYPVGVADIIFANGSDNYLMKSLRERGLLYKLQSYSGWNTATNSIGFAIGTGLLARKMTVEAKNKLLTRRYLDDWVYQANIRTTIADELYTLPDMGASYYSLGERTSIVEKRVTELMREFATKLDLVNDFEVTLPLSRMFECDIKF